MWEQERRASGSEEIRSELPQICIQFQRCIDFMISFSFFLALTGEDGRSISRQIWGVYHSLRSKTNTSVNTAVGDFCLFPQAKTTSTEQQQAETCKQLLLLLFLFLFVATKVSSCLIETVNQMGSFSWNSEQNKSWLTFDTLIQKKRPISFSSLCQVITPGRGLKWDLNLYPAMQQVSNTLRETCQVRKKERKKQHNIFPLLLK